MQFGRYEVIRKLGDGAMARVLLGRDPSGERVVLKMPVGDGADVAERFRAEARFGQRARHPSLADTLELFEHEGRPVLVAAYVEGASLEQLRQRGGPMPPGLVARVGRQVAEGLAFLHEAEDEKGQPLSLLHRGVTPGNVLVTPEGVAKLSDLGIARGSELPAKGALGAMGYLAPELLAGEPHTPAADLWALGVTLFEAALGRRAVEGGEREVREAITRGEIAKLREGEVLDETLQDGLFALLAPRDSRLQRARAAVNVWQRIESLLPVDEGWCRRVVGEVLADTHARGAAEAAEPRPQVAASASLAHPDGAAPTVRMSAVELKALEALAPGAPTEVMPAVDPLSGASTEPDGESLGQGFDETQKFPKPGPADSPIAPDQTSSRGWRSAAPTLLGVTAAEVAPSAPLAPPSQSAPSPAAGFPHAPAPWQTEPVIPAAPDEKTEAGAPPPRPPPGWRPQPDASGPPPGPPTQQAREISGPLPRMLRVEGAFRNETDLSLSAVRLPSASGPDSPALDAASPTPPPPSGDKPLDPSHRPPDPNALSIPTPPALESAAPLGAAPGVVVPEESTETAFPVGRPGSLPPADALAPGKSPGLAPSSAPKEAAFGDSAFGDSDRTVPMPPAPRAGFVGQRADPDDATERVERRPKPPARGDVRVLSEDSFGESELAWRPKSAKHIAIGAGVAITVAIATAAALFWLG